MKHQSKVMVSCTILLCTALNILLMCTVASRSYMFIGTASPVLSLMVFAGAEHKVLGIISGLWLVSFPLTLVVSVILTCFRKYQLFIYLMFADALWCGVTLLHALSIGSAGMSDFQLLCIGACVHVIIAIAIFRKFKQPEEACAKE